MTRSDPKEFLFFNRNTAGKPAAKAFVKRLKERTTDRDAVIAIKAFGTQLKAIASVRPLGPVGPLGITQPTLIANGDNDRMVPSVLSADLHHRIKGASRSSTPTPATAASSSTTRIRPRRRQFLTD